MEALYVLILAVDTSTTSGSMALVEDGRLVSEWTVGDVGTHADWLMRNIGRMLEGSSVTPEALDVLAVASGPGSFTGLRIGVSTVKGLAWALGKKVVGVSTLKALAMNLLYANGPVCPVLDARKKEVYAALYRPSGDGFEVLLPERAIQPAKLLDEIEELFRAGELSAPVYFTGTGLTVYGKAVTERLSEARLAPEPLWHIRASSVARLALEAAASGAVEPSALSPVYLRKSEAELKAKKAGQKV